MHAIERYHDFSYGHRVVGHEGHCALIHGHNGRVTFTVIAAQAQTMHQTSLGDPVNPVGRNSMLDNVGRVIDFDVIKSKLCQWLEDNWDHRFLVWEDDAAMRDLSDTVASYLCGATSGADDVLANSIAWVPFNPTAENMAQYLVDVVGPQQLAGTGVLLASCKFEETRKCSTTYVSEAF